MKAAFVVGGLHTESSGVARIVADLANAMVRGGNDVTVYTAVCDGQVPARQLLHDPDRLVALPGRWMGRLAYSPALRAHLAEAVKTVDVVHQHSLWMLPNHYGSAAARRHGKPVLFTAHGFLEPWALARGGWKKRLVASLFQNGDLDRARCIHINSLPELTSIRRYGLKNPVAIVPNGVDITPFRSMPDGAAFRARFPETQGKRIALFLSRLHQKKGLGHLVEAWARVTRDFPDWHLVLAGPDDGFEATIRGQIDTLRLKDSVSLVGPQTGADKMAAYAAAEAFLLPSFSEGFSMAVLEGLAAALPVVITPGCNFPEVGTREAGLIVEPDADGTERAMRTLFEMSEAERRAMGARGRAMVEQDYTWDGVARQLVSLYRWMQGGGTPPPFVVLN